MIPTKDVERMAFWLDVHKYKDAATMLRDLGAERDAAVADEIAHSKALNSAENERDAAQERLREMRDTARTFQIERDAAREEVGRLREALRAVMEWMPAFPKEAHHIVGAFDNYNAAIAAARAALKGPTP